MFELCGLPQSRRQQTYRANANYLARQISGLAAPYGKLSNTFEDGTRARILPFAFRDVAKQPCQLWVSHSDRICLATTLDGTLTLRDEHDGLHIEATLPDNEHGRSARLAIARGYITGLSICYGAAPGCERTFVESGNTIWEVSRVGWLREVSLARNPRFTQTYIRAAPFKDQRDPTEQQRITKFFSNL